MSKSVLVMDTPESCMDCQFCFEIYEGIDACCILDVDPNDNELLRNIEEDYFHDKPDWCPLKPMPEKISEEEYDMMATKGYDYGYFDGWNGYIIAMIGEETENEK